MVLVTESIKMIQGREAVQTTLAKVLIHAIETKIENETWHTNKPDVVKIQSAPYKLEDHKAKVQDSLK